MANKLRATVRALTPMISWVRWSKRTGSIEDGERRKSIVYIGFADKAAADIFYAHVIKKRPDWKWQRFPSRAAQPSLTVRASRNPASWNG